MRTIREMAIESVVCSGKEEDLTSAQRAIVNILVEFGEKWVKEVENHQIAAQSQENAALCSILEELANECMESDEDGRFVYPTRPGLARLVNEILKL